MNCGQFMEKAVRFNVKQDGLVGGTLWNPGVIGGKEVEGYFGRDALTSFSCVNIFRLGRCPCSPRSQP